MYKCYRQKDRKAIINSSSDLRGGVFLGATGM